MPDLLADLDRRQERLWKVIHQGPFWQTLRERGLDLDLYALLMREIYHYTRHNAQNQALAAVSVTSDRLSLLKFCLHHAYAEAGHDLMVLNDLTAVGIDSAWLTASMPLPATEAFIAYLYHVARVYDAVARLGYSYWAEGCYNYIRELTDAMRRDLQLNDKTMTFFMEHSTIDVAHLQQVKHVIVEWARTAVEQAQVTMVLERSLYLLGNILDCVHSAYQAGMRLKSISE